MFNLPSPVCRATAFARVYHPSIDLPALKAVADNLGGLGLSLGSPLSAKRMFAHVDGEDDSVDEQYHVGANKRRPPSCTEGSKGATCCLQPQAAAPPPPAQPHAPSTMDVGQTAAGLTGWPGSPVTWAVHSAHDEEGGPSKRIKTLWSTSDPLSMQQNR